MFCTTPLVNCNLHIQREFSLRQGTLIRPTWKLCFLYSISMWILQPGLQWHQKGIQSCTPPPPWLLKPSLCDANSWIQAPADQEKTHSEAGEDLACRSHGSITGLLRVYWLGHVQGITRGWRRNPRREVRWVQCWRQEMQPTWKVP